MITPEISIGVDHLLTDYATLGAVDKAIVVYTPDCRESASWVIAGLRARGLDPSAIPMRSLVDPGLWDRLHAVLPDPDSLPSRLVVFTLEAETMSHFGHFESVMNSYPTGLCQVIRIISSGPEFFSMGLLPTPSELLQRNATLLHHLMDQTKLQIVSSGGTHLTVELDSRFDWISNSGINRPGSFTILPAGEIATYPARVDGVLVVDGALHCNVISRFDTRTIDDPILIRIQDSVATEVSQGAGRTRGLVDACFKRENGRRVGELGFGTNFGVQSFVSENSHVNERHPSIHLGFGQHNQRLDLVSYEEEVHLDLITSDATLIVDDGGRSINLSNFDLLDVEHPDVRSVDVTGDCCSFGDGKLRIEPI